MASEEFVFTVEASVDTGIKRLGDEEAESIT